MEQFIRIGIVLGKRYLQLIGPISEDRPAVRRKLTRAKGTVQPEIVKAA